MDVITRVDNNGIVDDTSVGVCDEGEEAGVGCEAFDVSDDYFFDEIRAIFSVPTDLNGGGGIVYVCMKDGGELLDDSCV